MLELINSELVFTTLWSRNNGYGQLTRDADWVCLDAQNLWGAVDFSGAHIMPCKNIKTLDLKIFRRIGKTKLHSEFQILYLMIYLLMLAFKLVRGVFSTPPNTILFAKIIGNFNLKPLTIFAKMSILYAWLGPECAFGYGYKTHFLKFRWGYLPYKERWRLLN